jgi:hypothetical protein
MPAGLAVRAGIPQVEPKIRRADEREAVCLVNVFVGAPRHPRQGARDVHHRGPAILVQLVVPEGLDKPASLIVEELESTNHNPLDVPIHVLQTLFTLSHQ